MRIRVGLALLAAVGVAACSQTSATNTQAQGTTSPILREAQDALIVVAVKSKLTALDVDTATNVAVRVNNGAVFLRGVVRDPSESQRLSDAAAGVSGVRSVTTDLRVNSGLQRTSAKFADAALATEVAARLAEQAGINALSVKTSVTDGTVTLRGGVHSATVKSLMAATAASTHGVKAVVDHIEVNP
ncbi:MAG TPA: BON domain-containing protein [Candidatus Baltobacteraceae bacterium]